MRSLDGLDESGVDRMVPVEGRNLKGEKKRGGAVSWGGSIVDWREGDGL